MERKMLKQKNLWGDITGRLSQDNQKSFDQCSICLSFVVNPVCCFKGSIFCKQCLLENFLFQKQEIKKLTKKFEEQEQEKEKSKESKEEANNINKINDKDNNMIKAIDIYKENKNHDLKKCFWNFEHLNPFVKEIKEKPKNVLYCPACENRHIMGSKEYINLNMIINNDDKKNKFICSICEKILNIQKIIALKKCGHVFCLKCLEDVCKGDENCPKCNTQFIASDKILLKFTGTSYSSHNKVTSQIYIPSYKY
jgi:nitric oxide synthase-interacting protein